MIRMERKVFIICGVVGFLGLLSAALGFAAEAKRIKATQVTVSPGVCSYPTSRSPAFALGMTAAIALMVSQAVITMEIGCMCCQRTLALVSFTISWFTFTSAFLLLLGGAALNYPQGKVNSYYCYVFTPGYFAVAAVLSLISVNIGNACYLLTISTGKSVVNNPPFTSSQISVVIAMGQPQVSPIS